MLHRPPLTRQSGEGESEIGSWTAQIGAVRVHFGPGRLAELGEVARAELAREGLTAEGSHVLLVTDPGVRAAGHTQVAQESLTSAGFHVSVFDEVSENPTTDEVAAGRACAERVQKEAGAGIGLIVALGGGSAMDCAKGINFLLTNGGSMEDYWGKGKAEKPMLPSVGVPTTAGTGSEAQSFALVSRASDHVKMACGDEKARFRAVVLDPDLVTTAPPEVAALAGLDAISHAVESYVSTAANPVSRLYAREAWVRLARGFEVFLEARRAGEPGRAAAAELLLGAHLAGAAIEQSMLGAAHALANPLTARHGVPHGAAVLLALPAVVRFNSQDERIAWEYFDLADLAELPGYAQGKGWECLARHLEVLRTTGGLPSRLRDVGVAEGDLPKLAREAANQWTARFNPRPVETSDLLRIYEQLV